MSISNVLTKLESMGIDASIYPNKPELLDKVVEMVYAEQMDRMRNLINYLADEEVPQPLIHIVEDWAAYKVISNVRVMDPTYAPRGGKTTTDPVTALSAIPQGEIVKYRRLYKKRKRGSGWRL